MATKKASPKQDKKGKTFEEAMAELEEVVGKLEAGDIPLEESLAAFEAGVALVRTLQARLDEVQQKIELLTRGERGTIASRTLEED
jgi:exodeoxyribonuclease VII small subunit